MTNVAVAQRVGPIVKAVSAISKTAREGDVFSIRVTLAKPTTGRIRIKLTGQSADVVLRRNWQLPKGVTWSPDGSSLILSTKLDTFFIRIPVKNDTFRENLERVRLTIGEKGVDLSIKDVPLAHVKKNCF